MKLIMGRSLLSPDFLSFFFFFFTFSRSCFFVTGRQYKVGVINADVVNYIMTLSVFIYVQFPLRLSVDANILFFLYFLLTFLLFTSFV